MPFFRVRGIAGKSMTAHQSIPDWHPKREYLARYTRRAAISNERLIEIDDDHVVFRFKDYAQGGIWRTRRLRAEKFIRRFLQHVLPLRFVAIRYFGLLGNRCRGPAES